MAALDCEYHDRDGTEGVGMAVAVNPEAITFLPTAACHNQGSKVPLGNLRFRHPREADLAATPVREIR